MAGVTSTAAHDARIFVVDAADNGRHIVFLFALRFRFRRQLALVDRKLDRLSGRLRAQIVHSRLQTL